MGVDSTLGLTAAAASWVADTLKVCTRTPSLPCRSPALLGFKFLGSFDRLCMYVSTASEGAQQPFNNRGIFAVEGRSDRISKQSQAMRRN